MVCCCVCVVTTAVLLLPWHGAVIVATAFLLFLPWCHCHLFFVWCIFVVAAVLFSLFIVIAGVVV